MNGCSSANISLQLKQLKARNETFSEVSHKNHSVNRLQAMERLQPLIDKLDQSASAANFVADVEASFTQESIKVLTRDSKRSIWLAAEAVGNQNVLGWIAAAKDDLEQHAWAERIETPKPPAGMADTTLQDLATIVSVSPLHIQQVLGPRVAMVNSIIGSLQQRIPESSTVLASDITTANRQFSDEEASSIRELLRRQPARTEIRIPMKTKSLRMKSLQTKSLTRTMEGGFL